MWHTITKKLNYATKQFANNYARDLFFGLIANKFDDIYDRDKKKIDKYDIQCLSKRKTRENPGYGKII